ncbi:MAG: glycosyltransferase family 39 protein, partial [Gemmatimonadaceae bacterium]
MNERWRRWMVPAIALLALASSAIGITNWFTYDDRYIIELNPAAHSLHRWWTAFQMSYWPKDWGGDGYRPLTVIAFKIESVLGGGIPISFHAANILLYMLVSVLVYYLARRLLPEWAAWVTAALFAVHPVHVEAVAGIVGQSELIVALAVLSALLLYLRDRMTGELRPRSAIGICILYAIGCLSKEHGVVLPAILIAAELTVIDDAAPWRARVLRLRPFYLALTAIALAFIAMRAVVLSDHGIGGF